jgi:hypothetical protein
VQKSFFLESAPDHSGASRSIGLNVNLRIAFNSKQDRQRPVSKIAISITVINGEYGRYI